MTSRDWIDPLIPLHTSLAMSSTMPLENQKEETNCKMGLNLLVINAVNDWEHIHA